MDIEQSGRRQEPIADAQSGLIVYVTVLLLPDGHTRGALITDGRFGEICFSL